MKTIITTLFAIATIMTYGTPHLEVGLTAQDEAVAMAIDEGMSQERYLTLSYGTSGSQMLEEAFQARGEKFIEGATFVKNKSNGDIRNVPCIDPSLGNTGISYMKFLKQNRGAMFQKGDTIPVSGRMYGEPQAFNSLVSQKSKKMKKAIVISGEGKHMFRDEFDVKGTSYNFWPLGAAIHDNGAYAEEIAHFMNFNMPQMKVRRFKGTWSSEDFEKVSRWNEFTSALRGVKVYAFAQGFNLNTPTPVTTNTVTDANGNTQTTEVKGIPEFEKFFTAIESKLAAWKSGTEKCPIAKNAFVLLLAYQEAKANEGKETDQGIYKRFRSICTDYTIAQMVL